MNATPVTERSSYLLLLRFGLGIIALSLFSACSTGLPFLNGDSTPVLNGDGTPGSSDLRSSIATQGPIVISRVEEDGLGIELRGHQAPKLREADLVIRSVEESVSYAIERLSNPSRIQITLPELSLASEKYTRRVSLDELGLLKEIDLKATDEGLQLEVALNEGESSYDEDITYESEPIAGNLYVRFSQTIADTPQVTATKSARLVTEEKNHDRDPAQLTDNGQPTDGTVISELKSVRFEQAPAIGQIVVAEVDAPGVFTLEKTAPSEFVLTLEGVSHDPKAIQNLITAPSRTSKIRSVRVVQDGENTLVRVFADPLLQLEAIARSGSIVLQPVDRYLASPTRDVRAQVELEELETEQEVEEEIEASRQEETDSEEDDEQEEAADAEELLSEMTDIESEISALLDEAPRYTGRKISLDLQDTEISNALRIIAEVSNLNIIASDDVVGQVTLRLVDVPWDQALDVILKTNALDKVLEGNVMRIAPIGKLRDEREALKLAQEAEEGLEPLVVKYIRVSYAKAAELQPLVETVLTERGTVAFDERTNQLIVKDIRRGVKNVAELVGRLDLRTPQVLLETQIVEANRTFSRSLGSELGFSMIQSPATGNPTGDNFPNAISIGGSLLPGQSTGSSFPASISSASGSAVSFLLDSADGTRSLDYRLTALEDEGAIRIVSRPSVATTNNQQAVIKSVEKVRVKTPSGGLSVATGAGANASGSGGVATETIEIGIILEVTPQASPDYFVLLDINAKSSTFGAERVDDIPTEIERSATSSVLVSSGQTFAMGGIYKITDSDSVSGVPFLKDIPFFGHLFRRQTVKNADEELIFFITPRIIEGSFDDAAMKVAF